MTGTGAAAAGEPRPEPVVQRDIVVVGASAGGVEALGTLVAGLPPELPAAVFVVLHVSPGGTSVLPQILARRTPLPVAAASDGDRIERGQIYVAPPDHHMLLEDEQVILTRGPRENGLRPAIDPLFRSAARWHGARVIGVVLSGALDDGTAGLKMIVDAGGVGLVQDPDDALVPSMPRHAIEHDSPATAPIDEMADLLCAMLDAPIGSEEQRPPAASNPQSPHSAERSDDSEPRSGQLTSLTCPECGGTLWEHDEAGVFRFKCHVGHAYSSEALDLGQSEGVEMALWAALRTLQERADLFRRLSRRTRDGRRFEEKARIADEHAAALREFITSVGSEPIDTEGAG